MISSWTLCPLLIILLTTCLREGLCIKCWECRSDNNPACGEPFDNTTLPITNCNLLPDLPHLPGVRPTMCRKMRQKVNGEWKIFRDCAYLGQLGVSGDEKKCSVQSRHPSIIVEYCYCNRTDACNTGPMVYSNQLAVLLTAFGAITHLYYQ